MPELPEVETVRRVLESQLLGLKIEDIHIFYDKIIDNVEQQAFINALKGETFRKIERLGKYLIFILDHYSFVSHLRMEGKFFIKKHNAPLEKHEHLEFVLDSDTILRYHDTRKFGRFYLVSSTNMEDIKKIKEIAKLGPDGNQHLPIGEISDKLKKMHMPIKTALLDQTVIAGIGNIYADEILFNAKINPLKPANKLTIEEIEKICRATNEILNQAILDGGTTIRSYTSSLGVTGRFQQHLFVHTKEICSICHAKIKKIRVGGRGTYYCPICQKNDYAFKIIGASGMMAAGKTTLTNYLKELGYPIIDCDEINRDLLNGKDTKSQKLLASINDLAPSSFINGSLDKKLLRKALFKDESLKKALELLLHPVIIDEVFLKLDELNEKLEKPQIVFLSAPLLVEANLHKITDKVIWVSLDEELRLKRLMTRDNITIEDTLAILKQDKSEENILKIKEAKIPLVTLDNSNTLDDFKEKIKQILKQII